jgi:3-phenylpropionate/cinnamic acid dioxygenase small subunit
MTTTDIAPASPSVDPETHREIERFIYDEAALIDDRDFWTWLDLFTEDTRYLVPIRRNSHRDEFGLADSDIAHFDDDKFTLTKRVQRMTSGVAWTEDPPSIQRHLITNIRTDTLPNGDIQARSCFQAHRYRLDRDIEVFTGARTDQLRRTDQGWRIAARTVYLDLTTVLANNLNLFL